MTKKQQLAHDMYSKITDTEKISEDFLYNAICYFDISPEQVVTELNKLPTDIAKKLSDSFKECRESCRKCLSTTLSSADFSDIFHDPEIEDILFYQMAHGMPIQ